jgi:hypothetical protein
MDARLGGAAANGADPDGALDEESSPSA